MKSKWIVASVTILLITIVALVGLARYDAALAAQNEPAKIEGVLLDQLAANGTADFIVKMAEQADVSGAYSLQTKAEKGQYVFDTLMATAARTQPGLLAYLDSQNVEYKSFYIFNGVWVKQGTLAQAQAIAARADVAAVNANHTFQLDEPINAQPSTNQPNGVEANISFVKADQVWAMGVTGEGTVVADDDTGLDNTHPTIAPHYRGCVDPPECTVWDHNYNWFDAFGDSPNVPWDDYGHGTHTAGTMVGDDYLGNQIGMAPGAKLISCKNMQGGGGDDAHFIICFQWNLAPTDTAGNNPRPDLAPDSVNNSWGYGGGGVEAFRQIVDNLLAAGIVVEVSAGNEGSGCTTLRSPGDYQEVFTTGSVNHAYAFPGSLTGFSSRGPSILDGNYFPDFMAPGENVRSALPGNTYGSWSGTSMAGPHVTALIALIWSGNPALRGQIDTTYEIIKQTVVPLTGQGGSNCGGDYTVGPNNDWGYGTIDALAAVQMGIALGGAGQLDGTVTDASSGDPLEGVNINALRDDGYAWNKLTDVSGYYTMTVGAGMFTVEASRYGYLPETASSVEVITDTLTTQNFALTPLPSYVISGHVYDAATGDPLNATLEFTDAPVPPVTTDQYGFYSITVAEGTWTLKATALSYQSQEQVVVVGSDLTVDFHLNFQAEWVEISPLPTGCKDWTRFDGEYFAPTEKVYFMGGRNGTVFEGNIMSYDPATNTCADTGVAMIEAVANYTIIPLNNGSADLLCTFGGNYTTTNASDKVQCYDPLANTITQVSTLPGLLADYIPGGAAVVDNIVYVFGGFENWSSPYTMAETWAYDPVANSWTQKGDLTLGRGYINVAVVDGLIYGIGGDTFDGTNLIPESRAEVFDPATGTWNDGAVADLPMTTGEGRAFGFDTSSEYDQAGKIIIAGGGQWPNDTPEVFTYDVNANTYDLSFPDLHLTRRDQAGFFIPGNPMGTMWVFGGRSSASGYGGDSPPYALPEYYAVNVVVPQPNIKVTWPSLNVILPPNSDTFQTITIKNIGTLPLDWTLSEVTPVDWLAVSPAFGTLDPNGIAEVTVSFSSAGLVPGVYETDLEIDSNDPDTPNIMKPVTLTVKPLADLSIVKTDTPDPVFAGHPLTYTLEVNNLGPEDAPAVLVTDNLPANVTFDHASAGCTPSGQVVTCDVGDLAVGNSVTLEIVVIAPNTAGTLTNSAIVDGNVVDPVAENNASTTETVVEIEPADLQVIKEAPDQVRFGEVLTYTLYVTNLGTGDATGVKVVDNLPTGVSYVRASQGCGRVGLKVTCNIGALGAGEVIKLFIAVRVPSISETITNTATVSGNEPDPVAENNTSTVNTNIISPKNNFYLPIVSK
jgi:uncharacterized repeat protein (TIGR01451 family)